MEESRPETFAAEIPRHILNSGWSSGCASGTRRRRRITITAHSRARQSGCCLPVQRGLTARMTQPQPTHLECQGRRQPQRQGDTDPSRGPRCGRHHTRASCRLYYCACCFEVADTWVSLSPLMSHRGLSNTNQRLSRVAERERESRIAVFLIQTNVSLPKAVPSRAPKCLSLST